MESEPVKIGNYEIIRAIGKGKFAIVYRARRITDGAIVALKRINVDTIDEKSRDKCLKEVRLLQSLDHPNVIRYLDSFITENDLVIVVEWAAAGDLKRQLRKAQERGYGFEERVIWKYFSQISYAIQHMHERRIMHRDLKPANIFLTLDGTVKVGDLGLSRELSDQTLQVHSKVGTPLYMSPEVLRGDGYDFKSDVWSLGCLLYELAMLKSPFKAEGLNLYALFQKISQGEYQPLPDNYSGELRTLAYSMISTQPSERPDIAYVCKVAGDMRALTAEKYTAQKKTAELGGDVDGAGNQVNTQMLPSPVIEPPPNVGGDTRPQRQRLMSPDINRAAGGAIGGGVEDHGLTPTQKVSGGSGGGGWGSSNENGDGKSRGDRREYDMGDQKDGSDGVGFERKSQALPRRNGAADNPTRRSSEDNNNSYNDVASKPPRKAIPILSSHSQRQQPPLSNEVTTRLVSSVQKGKSRSDDKLDVPEGGDSRNRKASNTRLEGGSDKSANREASERDDKPGTRDRNNPYLRPKMGFKSEGLAVENMIDDGPSGANQKTFLNRDVGEDTRTSSSSSSSSSSAIGKMSVLFDKLSALSVPLNEAELAEQLAVARRARGVTVSSSMLPPAPTRLLPFHFALDLSRMGRIAGYSAGGGAGFLQFRTMCDVCIWLCLKLRGKCAETADRIDCDEASPMTIAKQLLVAAQAAGVESVILSSISPSSLVPGYGDSVCTFMASLCDLLLASNNAMDGGAARMLVYPDSSQTLRIDDLEVDDDAIDQASVDDNITQNDDNEFAISRSDSGGGGTVTGLGASGDIGSILPSVDPALWRAELERVGPLLVGTVKSNRDKQLTLAGASSSWSVNIGSLQGHASIWLGQGDRNRKQELVRDLVHQLSGLAHDIKGDVSGIQRAEAGLMKKDSVDPFSQAFLLHKKALNKLEASLTHKMKQVEDLSARVTELEEQLEERREQLGDHSSSDIGAGGNGSAPSEIIRLSRALQELRRECRGMDLGIALLAADLTNRRGGQVKSAATAKNRKRNKGTRFGKKKIGDSGDGSDSDV